MRKNEISGIARERKALQKAIKGEFVGLYPCSKKFFEVFSKNY